MGVRGVLMAVAAAGVMLAGPACAQSDALSTSWKVGGLAFGSSSGYPGVTSSPPDRVSDLHDKVRLGASELPGLEGYATVRPWISMDPTPDGRVQGMSGVLVDVPLGSSFVFTPSIGAGYVNRSSVDATPTMEFRSQIELGYEFENKSRFTLGYSRITSTGGAVEARDPNNVFGLYYRLPFGAITGQ